MTARIIATTTMRMMYGTKLTIEKETEDVATFPALSLMEKVTIWFPASNVAV